MDIEKIVVSSRRYVVVHHLGAYREIGVAFEKLFSTAPACGLEMVGLPSAFYFDDPRETPEAELRGAAAYPVAAGTEVNHPDLDVIDLPGGEFVSTIYTGAYEGLPKAWGEFVEVTEKFNPARSWSIEEYLNDCNEVPPADLATRIMESMD